MAAIEAFFEHLATKRSYPHFKEINGTCLWRVENAGNWLIQLNQGQLTTHTCDQNTPADCIFTCSQEDFVRMIQRQLYPFTAFLQGRLIVTGDVSLANLCTRMLFRLPSEELVQR
ncbi:MAG: SCP2 sterol-binding domain-containing protein [Ktedonobacteraceae bacterium]|nr:SCP2 sterol-binding domain-containing protein [Ktedonobacteraceae bacterium]MBO0794628.1 SCP2 sterol-binding domain-containing protein [Ktedonobacteraceae bacterium]